VVVRLQANPDPMLVVSHCLLSHPCLRWVEFPEGTSTMPAPKGRHTVTC
jgi:hypothetical protein